MTMRKLLRKRNAFRQLLQNLETRPLCADGQTLSGGWLSQPLLVSLALPQAHLAVLVRRTPLDHGRQLTKYIERTTNSV